MSTYTVFPLGQSCPDGWSDYVRACLEAQNPGPFMRIFYTPYDLPSKVATPGTLLVSLGEIPIELAGIKEDDTLTWGRFRGAEISNTWRWERISKDMESQYSAWKVLRDWTSMLHTSCGKILEDTLHGCEALPAVPHEILAEHPVYVLGHEITPDTPAPEAERIRFLERSLRVLAGGASVVAPVGPIVSGEKRLLVLWPAWIVYEDATEPKPVPNELFQRMRLRGYIDDDYFQDQKAVWAYTTCPVVSWLSEREGRLLKTMHEILGRLKRG